MRTIKNRRKMRAEVFSSALCFLGPVFYIVRSDVLSPTPAISSEQEANEDEVVS